jgi:histidinol dehydrogenase
MVGIQKVGLYIPGGSAPLFSTVLMLAIPAKLAGCREIILCTPAGKNGKIHPAILYTAQLTGVTRIFKIGGAQAIAAMAYGTETVPSVYKIFGPGNQYVTTAKQLVQMQGLAIDMPAGPSEVCVLADATADASFIAADLLSQAEHGPDSQVLLITTDPGLVEKVNVEIEKRLETIPRRDIAIKALNNSKSILVNNMEEAIELVNEYAAEHLIITCANEDEVAEKITSAGSVFIGKYSPESVGDYASGTNHTLPTNGFAHAYSGVSVDSFVKKITFQKLTPSGLQNIASTVIQMAEAEGLEAHATAVKVRIDSLTQDGESRDENPANANKDFAPVFDMGRVFDLERLVRKNVMELQPYSSARSEYKGEGKIFLDANENSLGSPLTKWYNRYPDPLQWELKKKISKIKNVEPENILLGNGSDECIDLLIRAFCDPGRDNIIICPPTYGMYRVCAEVNDVEVKEVMLTPVYQLNMEALEQAIDANTKLVFFCSPNNPTGNSLDREDIEMVLNNFDGLVIVDEAYINFSRHRSFLAELKDYPNLVVLQTLSKAWGLAALRLGMNFASKEIISILNKIKPPYNINQATQDLAIKALDNLDDVNTMIREIVKERETLVKELVAVPYVQKVFPSEANFILVRMDNADSVYEYLKTNGIIVRNRSRVVLCDDSLRITVGTKDQNRKLIDTLKAFK